MWRGNNFWIGIRNWPKSDRYDNSGQHMHDELKNILEVLCSYWNQERYFKNLCGSHFWIYMYLNCLLLASVKCLVTVGKQIPHYLNCAENCYCYHCYRKKCANSKRPQPFMHLKGYVIDQSLTSMASKIKIIKKAASSHDFLSLKNVKWPESWNPPWNVLVA